MKRLKLNDQKGIALRNKIVKTINTTWVRLGCHVFSGQALWGRRALQIEHRYFNRLIIGTGPKGRSIYIYPYKFRTRIPMGICEFMDMMANKGAIVGCACNIEDAWDIVYDDEREYKRKKRTYAYSAHLNEYYNNKGVNDDE